MTIEPAFPVLGALLAAASCAACAGAAPQVLTLSGSAVGAEGAIVRRQLDRFAAAHPSISVALRVTPDAADQRHQLYVQWLNGHAADPDVLQLDVIWTAEFGAAGWIAPLDRFAPPVGSFFAPAIEAARWRGTLFALPWFVDVGMLYRRIDAVPRPPRDLADLTVLARRAQQDRSLAYGLVWQGARYEGLVTVFLEYLVAYGGAIIDGSGRVVVDSEAAVSALTYMRDAIYSDHIVPTAVLTWQEEQTRFAFQNGQAAFMRNWPYAYGLMQDPAASAVAGRFAVGAIPPGPGGAAAAALGGSALAINAFSDQPDEAYQLIAFLLEPAQMIERARDVGQFPPVRALYENGQLEGVLNVAPATARDVIDHAVPRPVTPVYSELSEILQVALHRALTRQQEPRAALQAAAGGIRGLLARVQLDVLR